MFGTYQLFSSSGRESESRAFGPFNRIFGKSLGSMCLGAYDDDDAYKRYVVVHVLQIF